MVAILLRVFNAIKNYSMVMRVILINGVLKLLIAYIFLIFLLTYI